MRTRMPRWHLWEPLLSNFQTSDALKSASPLGWKLKGISRRLAFPMPILKQFSISLMPTTPFHWKMPVTKRMRSSFNGWWKRRHKIERTSYNIWMVSILPTLTEPPFSKTLIVKLRIWTVSRIGQPPWTPRSKPRRHNAKNSQTISTVWGSMVSNSSISLITVGQMWIASKRRRTRSERRSMPELWTLRERNLKSIWMTHLFQNKIEVDS